MLATQINWFLAILPILILILLMTVFHMGGSQAGLFTFFTTILIAWLFFGTSPSILLAAAIKSVFLSLDVLLIIWGAMYLYQITKAAGTIQKIGEFLSAFTSNKAYLGIFLGWLFPSFLQGMGGFGVPVAVSAPLLVSVGFSPITAILLSSIGHGWGVSFGSMGTSIRTLEAATGLPFSTFAPQAAILLGITAVISGLVVMFMAGGWKNLMRALPLTGLCAAILSLGQYLIAKTDFWVMAVTLPSLISLLVALILVGTFSKDSRKWVKSLDKYNKKTIFNALVPYLLLVVLILSFNFFKPLEQFFAPFDFSIQFPPLTTTMGFLTPAESSKRINIFLHPGTILMITGLLSFVFFRRTDLINPGLHPSLIADTIAGAKKTTLAIFALVGTAASMRHAGMISLLAHGISSFIPRDLYPAVSPFIGALGAFITGSNNNSNVLFAALQLQTADLLRLPAAWILAGQTTGGAMGSIMAPAKIILGCNTVGLDGKEGQVISRLLITCLVIILIIGVTLLFISG